MEKLGYDDLMKNIYTFDPTDKLLMIILKQLLDEICHEEGENLYSFDSDIETEENHELVAKWFKCLHGLSPMRNITRYNGSQKKAFNMIKHICNKLKDKGVKLETKIIAVKTISGKYTTRTKHFIKLEL